MRRILIGTLSALSFLISAPAFAGWAPNGLVVGTGAGQQISPQAAPDGTGGCFVVWSGWRGVDYNIYAQHIDRNGNELWTPNGATVTDAINDQYDPQVVSDGAGGAIVSWTDNRTGEFQIYAQRIDAGGTPVWTAGGVPICVVPGLFHSASTLIPDGSGGALIVWQFASGLAADIYAQRVNASGTPLFPANGIPICNATDSQVLPRLIETSPGVAMIVWSDRRSGSWNVYMQRFDLQNNSIPWAANGVPAGLLGGETSLRVAAGDSGELLLTTNDRVQMVSPAGVPQWGGGIVTASGTNQMVSDGSGGAILMSRPGYSSEIRVYRLSPAGAHLWGAGVSITGPLGVASTFHVARSADRVLCVWLDHRNGTGWDFYAQHVDITNEEICGKISGTLIAQPPTATVPSSIRITDSASFVIPWSDQFAVSLQRVHSLSLGWGAPECVITSIEDIPADEGGFVQVDWDAGDRDNGVDATHYSLWRAVDTVPFASDMPLQSETIVSSLAEVGPAFSGKAFFVASTPEGPPAWEWVGSVAATGAMSYSTPVPTRRDATPGDPAEHALMIVTHGADAFEVWESAVVMGASEDNLAPAAPLLLSAFRNGADVDLDWNPSGANEADLADYVIYRGDSPGVTSATGVAIGNTGGLEFTDAGAPLTALYYVVVARDVHDNESAPSNEAIIATPTGADTPPLNALRLGPNAPNPFGASTTFQLGLPAATTVDIAVYDVAGRRVRGFSRAVPAGWQSFAFDGRDGRGHPLPSGVYFLRVSTGSDAITRKFVVQR